MWLTIWQLIAISKGTLCYVISICPDKLGISSSNSISAKTRFKNEANMHSLYIFCYLWLMKRYRISARHFRQNRHFPKGPFAISFAFLFIIWRFRRLIAISAIFAKYAIFANIATFQRVPLSSHLNFCLQFGVFGD